ncbi:MAG: hypothetical protein JXA09_10695 [Anaerolineae bacterium]|nr:hypothetical protein [Anaerolineae bacterium]
MPSPWDRAASVLLDGKVYLIGGYRPKGSLTPAADVYDPATDTWSQVADLPTPRGDPASCVLDGRIYSISGFIDRDIGAVEVYDPVTNAWESGPEFPRVRHVHTVACAGKIYVLCGGSNTDAWEYDPAR